MNPLLKIVIVIIAAWVLLAYFVPMLHGIPAIAITLVSAAIVLGAIYLVWKAIEGL